MGIPCAVLAFCIAIAFLLLSPHGVYGRSHFHKGKQSHRGRIGGQTMESPVGSPSVPPTEDTSTVISPPSDGSSDSCIFDVRSFGAVGDGSTDDTEAFRSAWKAACAVESATLLVPADGVFMLTSTIFSGPCQPGLVFQVNETTSQKKKGFFLMVLSTFAELEWTMEINAGGGSDHAAGRPRLLAGEGQQAAMAGVLRARRDDFGRRRNHGGERRRVVETPL